MGVGRVWRKRRSKSGSPEQRRIRGVRRGGGRERKHSIIFPREVLGGARTRISDGMSILIIMPLARLLLLLLLLRRLGEEWWCLLV